MLQNLRSCDIAILIDVTDHKNRNPLSFTKLHHGHGTVLHLRNAAGRGFIFFIIQRLDGVYDQNIRL